MALHESPHNEAISSVNPGIKITNVPAPVSVPLKVAEAAEDILHVPNFRDIQENFNIRTAGDGFQLTPTMTEPMIDVMPATPINYPIQMESSMGTPIEANGVRASYEEHGVELGPAADVSPSMGDDNIFPNNESEGDSTIFSFSSKAHVPKSVSWKRRAQIQTKNNIGLHTPVQCLKGKRVLSEVGEATDIKESELSKKKARKDGGLVIEDSELVEAVEQPHQSQ
ncbi:hypothetical protein FCV25MIE_29304 [Fagus crenata]